MNKKKKKILIADDDREIVDVLQIILRDAGYVVAATQGNTLQQVHQAHPDLLLLDIWMSGEDGREIATYLKRQPFTKHIPIVIMSANRDTEKIAKEVKAEDFIEKPFDTEELLTKIRKFLPREKGKG